MARTLNKLTEVAVRGARQPGRQSDGGGLYLNISKTGSKSWLFMWTPPADKRREMGLGSYPTITLARARQIAAASRLAVAEGRDPIKERDQAPEPTFGEEADAYIETIKSEWKNAKHAEQWRHALEVRCASIRDKLVSAIATQDVVSVLRQKLTIGPKDKRVTGEFWLLMPETAGRVRNRIERVLNYSKTQGRRTGENPAAWKGHLENILPKRPKLTRGHQPALPYEKVPAFMRDLAAQEGLAARAAEITILTWARSREALHMEWSEIDFDKRVWVVPGTRMKMSKEHTVPLSDRAMDILRDLLGSGTNHRYVFPGQQRKSDDGERPLSSMAMLMLLRRMGYHDITMHGFRSTARDWAGDETPFPREVVEHALAHKVGSDVEAAYRRQTALAKRTKLMKVWASYCYPRTGNVVVLKKEEAA